MESFALMLAPDKKDLKIILKFIEFILKPIVKDSLHFKYEVSTVLSKVNVIY